MTIYMDDVLMTVIMLVPLAIGVYFKKKGLLDTRMSCRLILITGILLRLLYVIYTPEYTRQHDFYGLFNDDIGHGRYITYLYENGKLPDFDPRNIMEFYHPPLHHFICAVMLRALNAFGFNVKENGAEAIQLLPMLYSVMFTVAAYKAFTVLKIKGSALAVSTALVTFHPTLIIMAGNLNNDMLCSLFTMLAILCALKWSEDRRLVNILLLALSIGLGMMTKLSAALIAPPVAAVFLYELIVRKKERLRLIGQYAAFGVLCIPLGMWWPVRSFVKFGVPFNYIPKLSEDSWQYISVPAWQRLVNWLPFQFASPFTQWKEYGDPYDEFNPIIALMKNAMFDEALLFGTSITMQSFCTMLFFTGIVVAVIAAIAHVKLWRVKEASLETKMLLTLISAIIFINYIVFCLRFPHVCTENMRYCVPLIFTAPAAIGLCLCSSDKKAAMKPRPVIACCAAFCSLSAFVYTALMYFSHY